jgi:hypothetical protein
MRELTFDDVQVAASAPWDVSRHEYGEFGFDLSSQDGIEDLKSWVSGMMGFGPSFAIVDDDDCLIACTGMFRPPEYPTPDEWCMWFFGSERLPGVAKPLMRSMRRWLSMCAADLEAQRFVCRTTESADEAKKWFAVLGFRHEGNVGNQHVYVWHREH